MSVVPIACAKCGAPLQVSDRARFVTCNYCNSSLQITTSDGATWSELREDLAALKSETQRAADASALAAAAGERAATASERAADASTKAAGTNERIAMELALTRLQSDLVAAEAELADARASLKSVQGTFSAIWKEGTAKNRVRLAEGRVRAVRTEIDRLDSKLAPALRPSPGSWTSGASFGLVLGVFLAAAYMYRGYHAWLADKTGETSYMPCFCVGPLLVFLGAMIGGLVGRRINRA